MVDIDTEAEKSLSTLIHLDQLNNSHILADAPQLCKGEKVGMGEGNDVD